MKRPLIAVVLVFILLAVSASACLTSTNNSSKSAQGVALAAEPTGGSWKPFVLNSSDAVRSTPPPSQGSAQYNQDLNELKALQLNRTPQINENITYWNNGSVVRWNEIARDLVVKNNTLSPVDSRVYALLTVAQYDALVAAWNNKYTFNRSSPHELDSSIQPAVQTTSDPAYPSDHAAVAGASAAVLSYLYPNETAWISKQAAADEESRLAAGVNFRSDIIAGDSLGRTVAQQVIDRSKNDGSNDAWNGAAPTGPGKWFSTASPLEPPLLPNWGNVTPWLLNSSELIMPAAPPAFGSAQFNASLAEVKQIGNSRTAEQQQIAEFWSNSTPPSYWNHVAGDLVQSYTLNELRSARALALMNTATMDAGICCWKAKYEYWYLRPIQADPTIKTAFSTPNFPSYTSAHSSFSEAAAGVLSYIFPKETTQLQAQAQQASLSRLYAGVHYRFDCDQGLEVGSKVAHRAIQRGQLDGSPQ
ncbi:MAG: vanadium-dependent haloperoxidase [Halobacteriota archaeon]